VQIPEETVAPSAPATSEFGEEAFKAAVRRAKQYIVDGDIMQVVLSQRMSKPFAATPLSLYRALRTLNPSPYMFYFNFEDFHVVGASPEILVRLEDREGKNLVTLRPIAGTRKRGATPEEDQALAQELLAHPKERAEHVMLIDLERNDLGRVCRTGTVKPTELMVIERYSHVMHIVSNVEGRLQPGLNAIDVLRATFPAGTVSGAPKIRAMQIIRELEPEERKIYTGTIGYITPSRDMFFNVPIRTLLIENRKSKIENRKGEMGVGGGITHYSTAEGEYEECLVKARFLRVA